MPVVSDSEIKKIKETIYVEVGNSIKKVRLEKGYTQVQLSQMILSDRQYMYKIESGKVGLTLAKLMLIAKALEIPAAELLPKD